MAEKTYEELENALLVKQQETVAEFQKALDSFNKAAQKIEIPSNRLGAEHMNTLNRIRTNLEMNLNEVNQIAQNLEHKINPPKPQVPAHDPAAVPRP